MKLEVLREIIKKKKIKMNLQLLQIWQQVIVRFLKVESH